MKSLRTHLFHFAFYACVVALIATIGVVASTRKPALAQEAAAAPAPAQAGADTTALNQLSTAFAHVVDTASPAVVSIQVAKKMGRQGGFMQGPEGMSPREFFEHFFGGGMPGFGLPNEMQRGGRQQEQPEQEAPEGEAIPYGEGSGFIVSPDGYIVTNNHVVQGADEVRVKLADDREFTAKVVGSDPQTEVALIKVDASNLPSLPLADSDQLKVGEWVVAIGNPFGLSHTVTAGIVSARSRGSAGISGPAYADFIQTDAAINPGNSGGPLLNLNGEVVGLNTAILTRSGGYMGIGFAIPSNMVKYVQSQLTENGSVARGFLGVSIQNLTPELAECFNMKDNKGVLVASVQPASPAEKAGIQRDDVIVQYDGHTAEEVGSFRSRVSTTKPGTQVPVVVMRKGERIELTIEVGTLDTKAMAAASAEPGSQPRPLGLAVQNLTDDAAAQLGLVGQKGVLVSEVAPGSQAHRAGIEPGMLIQEVNRQPVSNTQEFQQALKNAEPGKPILFLVTDKNASHYVAIRPAK